MIRFKIFLLDVDGVLVLPPQLFSEQYCEKYGIDVKTQQEFYSTKEFEDALIGKYDLLDAISKHKDMWQWNRSPQELLDMWFEAENYVNNELLDVAQHFRENGGRVYLATQQERHRSKYLKDIVFKGKIDGSFATCDIGLNKHDNAFWEDILKRLSKLHPGLSAQQIVYYDDRQNLVDIAVSHSIHASVYQSADQVLADIL